MFSDSGYDQQFTYTAVGRLQRDVVHACLDAKIVLATSVLELNCGTGEDALWLAGRGCMVLATDQSAEMVAATAEKARKGGMSSRIKTALLDMRSCSAEEFDAPFHVILSNFGGLNCLSPDEVQRLGEVLPRLLGAGGYFIAVLMGRFCAWETLYFLLKGKPGEAFRRFGGGPVEAPLGAGQSVRTWYYSPAEFLRFFPDLAVRSIQPVGCWLPPSYLDPWFSRHQALLRFLNMLEQKSRGRLWAWAADHFIVVLCKEEGAGY